MDTYAQLRFEHEIDVHSYYQTAKSYSTAAWSSMPAQ